MDVVPAAAMLLVPLQSGAEPAQAPAPAPPPIIAMPPSQSGETPRPEQQLVRWMMSPVLCRGAGAGVTARAVVRASDAQLSLSWRGIGQIRLIALDFRIDSTGCPLSIARAGSASDYSGEAQDVIPAFVAARFAAGA